MARCTSVHPCILWYIFTHGHHIEVDISAAILLYYFHDHLAARPNPPLERKP
jgi:hypothetical protein